MVCGVYGADVSVVVVRAWREGIEDAVDEVGEGFFGEGVGTWG